MINTNDDLEYVFKLGYFSYLNTPHVHPVLHITCVNTSSRHSRVGAKSVNPYQKILSQLGMKACKLLQKLA